MLGRDVYLHRLRASIASMAAAMGGVDVLVFTGACLGWISVPGREVGQAWR